MASGDSSVTVFGYTALLSLLARVRRSTTKTQAIANCLLRCIEILSSSWALAMDKVTSLTHSNHKTPVKADTNSFMMKHGDSLLLSASCAHGSHVHVQQDPCQRHTSCLTFR